MARGFNMDDPAVQEKIRRGSHEYVLGDGRHGQYVPKDYHHQEFPKVMDKTPKPARKEFKTEEEYGRAVEDWNQKLTRSIVRDREDEKEWIAAHPAEEQPKAAKKTKAA